MSAKVSRKRNIVSDGFPSGTVTGTTFYWDGVTIKHGPVNTTGAISAVIGTQNTESEGHPFSHRRGGNRGDVGGPFFTTKTFVKGGSVPTFVLGPFWVDNYPVKNRTKYVGPCLAINPALAEFPPVPSLIGMDQKGADAVARCKPTNNVSALSVALGELFTEHLPKLPGVPHWKGRNRVARQAGQEYLNVEFGWKPLLAEVRSLSEGVSNAERILSQYIRDSGRPVRRSYTFDTETSESSTTWNNKLGYCPVDASIMYDGSAGVLRRTTRTVKERWFKGCFTYHLDPDILGSEKMSEISLYAEKILGIDLTPSTMWDLTPWSWAADWFTNAGSVISTASDMASDGLVMQYGYVMEKTTTENIYTLEGTSGIKGVSRPTPVTFVRETKVRHRANPFGFGLTWEGLSPRQLAIAAALGLTRPS